MTYGFAPDADVRADAVESRGADGMRVRPRRATASGGRSRSRRSAGSRSTTRWPPRRSGSPPGSRSTRSRRRSRRAGRRRIAAQLIRRGRRDDRRRHLQRVARVGRSPRSSCWPGCPAGGSPCSARCSSWATSTRRATSGSARPRPAVVDRLVVVGDGRGRDRAAARATPGSPADALVEVGRPRGGAGDAARATLATGDVVLVKASRGVELDLLVDELVAALDGPAPADDRRADPGPAARVRDRRDPDAAVHPAAAGDRASRSRSGSRARTATRSSTARRRWAAC